MLAPTKTGEWWSDLRWYPLSDGILDLNLDIDISGLLWVDAELLWVDAEKSVTNALGIMGNL